MPGAGSLASRSRRAVLIMNWPLVSNQKQPRVDPASVRCRAYVCNCGPALAQWGVVVSIGADQIKLACYVMTSRGKQTGLQARTIDCIFSSHSLFPSFPFLLFRTNLLQFILLTCFTLWHRSFFLHSFKLMTYSLHVFFTLSVNFLFYLAVQSMWKKYIKLLFPHWFNC